jgi:hypothetical protein
VWIFFTQNIVVSAQNDAQSIVGTSETAADKPEMPAAAASADTVPPSSALLRTNENGDSIATDSAKVAKVPLPKKKSAIDAQIDYTANDSIVFFADGTGYLYGQGDVTYKNFNLKSDYMRVKMDSNIIYARGVPDSLGVLQGKPVFSEGERTFDSNELFYNLKTKKAFVRQAVTQEGEGYIVSESTKMNEDHLLSIYHGKYTTCDDHECPHFYLFITKGKAKTGEYIVSGPAQMYLADIPLPLVIPFGYFPFNKSYSSGLLMPSYADEMHRGLGLIHGGYYFAFNDYVDTELRSEIYTKGTWALSLNSSYIKRYKFRGNVNVSYREDVTGEKDMPDYQKAKNLNIGWSHSQDTKANPYTTLSASVNFSTSGYNRSNINSHSRPDLNSENTKSSSVSFSKRFPRIPSLNITGAVNVSQRTRDSTISMTLPDISIAYSSTKIFKRKNQMGNERWYEKITMSYSGTFQNSVSSIKEDRLLKSSFSKDWRNGAKHNIPVSATFSVLNYINISPSVTYTERWYTNSYNKSWNDVTQREVIDTINGFNRVFDFNVGVSASTKVYGYFVPIKGLKKLLGLEMIRHVLTPTLSYAWRPDFGDPMWNYYGSYTKTTPDSKNPSLIHEQEVQYSRFGTNAMYGTPGQGRSQQLTFSLGNNLEAKFVNKDDTTGTKPYKVVSLIDNFSLSSSYNMVADSMKLGLINAQLRIKFGKFYTLSLSTTFDPYAYSLRDSTKVYPKGQPVRVSKYTWNEGRFPRWSGVGTSFTYTLNNGTFKKIFGKNQEKTNNANQNKDEDEALNTDLSATPESLEKNAQKEDDKKIELDNDGYEKVQIPWSIGISYSARIAPSGLPEDFMYDKMRYKNIITHNLSLSCSLSLGQNWSANTNISYDFLAKDFSYTNINVRRNLHCWSMSASFVPFGIYKSYNFHIGVNASMLQDLKYDKQSRSQSQTPIIWY